MSKPSGRFSRYPAVNRDVPGHGATYPEREAAALGANVASGGEVHALSAQANPEPEVEVERPGPRFTVRLADMTVTEVLVWVGNDPDRARWAHAEEAVGRNRKGVLSALAE